MKAQHAIDLLLAFHILELQCSRTSTCFELGVRNYNTSRSMFVLFQWSCCCYWCCFSQSICCINKMRCYGTMCAYDETNYKKNIRKTLIGENNQHINKKSLTRFILFKGLKKSVFAKLFWSYLFFLLLVT